VNRRTIFFTFDAFLLYTIYRKLSARERVREGRGIMKLCFDFPIISLAGAKDQVLKGPAQRGSQQNNGNIFLYKIKKD